MRLESYKLKETQETRQEIRDKRKKQETLQL